MSLSCHNNRKPYSKHEQRATECGEPHPILNEFS